MAGRAALLMCVISGAWLLGSTLGWLPANSETVPVAVGFLANLTGVFVLRRSLSMGVGLIVGVGALSAVGVAWQTGGIVSPAAMWLAFMPALAAVLGGTLIAAPIAVLALASATALFAFATPSAEASAAMIDASFALRHLTSLLSVGCLVTLVVVMVERARTRSFEDGTAARARLEAANAQLQEAQVAAEAAISSRSAFLDRLDHDLRSPISAILGACDLMEAGDDAGERGRRLEDLRSSSRMLLRRLDDMVAFRDRADGVGAAFDPRALLEMVAARYRDVAAAAQLDMAVEVADDVPERMAADEGRLIAALDKLVANAVANTSVGAVTIRASIDSHQRDSMLRLSVWDTGVGVEEARLSRLLTDSSAASGLQLCRRMVESLGGSLGATSQPGVGSTFWVTLPFTEIDVPGVGSARDVPGPAAAPNDATSVLAEFEILVVDDDETSRRVVTRRLELVGASVLSVASGAEALRALEREPDHFDLVLLDMHMPQQSGLQVAAAIRSRPGFEDLPLVLMSSRIGAEDQREAADLGVRHLLQRPVAMDRLIACALDVRVLPSQRTRGPRRLLVVDDNETNVRIARRVLERRGYSVDTARGGGEAVELAAANQYDAVLMDCRMPDLSGPDATARIRALGTERARVPVIAVTASPHPGDRERCLEVGMNAYLLKPVDYDAVERLIEELRVGPGSAPGSRLSAEPVLERPSEDFDWSVLDQYLETEEDHEFVAQLLRDWLDNADRGVGELTDAVDAADAARLRDDAHRLKGTSATIGAIRFAAVCSELESLALTGTTEGGDALVDDLAVAFVSAARSARTRLKQSPPIRGGSVAGS